MARGLRRNGTGKRLILMNPPFGGKEGKDAQTRFAYKTGATQVLFLQHVIDNLRSGGRCGIVLDEGVLFRTNETAFAQTKRKLLDECDLWCIVSLPSGAFVNAGAGAKTNLLFFTRGKPTERIWYFDLSDIKMGKKSPLTIGHFEEFSSSCPDAGTAGIPGPWSGRRSRRGVMTSRRSTRMPSGMRTHARLRSCWISSRPRVGKWRRHWRRCGL